MFQPTALITFACTLPQSTTTAHLVMKVNLGLLGSLGNSTAAFGLVLLRRCGQVVYRSLIEMTLTGWLSREAGKEV